MTELIGCLTKGTVQLDFIITGYMLDNHQFINKGGKNGNMDFMCKIK